jgi:hypothetical protein
LQSWIEASCRGMIVMTTCKNIIALSRGETVRMPFPIHLHSPEDMS